MLFWERFWYYVVFFWSLVTLMTVLTGCAFPAEGAVEGENKSTPTCVLTTAQLPWRQSDSGTPGTARGFLANGDHLGWDVAMSEGRPVYPIGCGIIRLARAATGYGTLVVVIEHQLSPGLFFQNGNGERVFVERFLSIYGHIRPTRDRAAQEPALDLMVGSMVTASTPIGYIEHHALNGDGDEHLHLGIRLQSVTAAQRVDARGWFRGYDTSPSQRVWFADPEEVLTRLRGELMDAAVSVPDASGLMDRVSVPLDVAIDQPIRMVPGPDVQLTANTDTGSYQDVTNMDASVPDHLAVMSVDAAIDRETLIVDASALPDAVSGEGRIRYEFRVRSVLRVTAPYRLRDLWWRPIVCQNTGSIEPEVTIDGWIRCDATRLALFDGSVFLPDRPEWGDMGQVGTVGNVPARCTPMMGAEWRITSLSHSQVLYSGPASGLRCAAVDTQDRLQFPE